MRLLDLPTAFRSKAHVLREDAAAEQAATAWERAAELLEEALSGSSFEPLTLEEAEVAGGYTRRHLARLIRDGTIPNAGEPGSPRILRCHLPVKPGHAVASRATLVTSSRTQVARAVAGGH